MTRFNSLQILFTLLLVKLFVLDQKKIHDIINITKLFLKSKRKLPSNIVSGTLNFLKTKN